MAQPSSGPVEFCAGAVVVDDSGRLLLVRRGRPPAVGSWTVPGGRCRPDEPPEAACVREVAEETGLTVDVVRWLGRVTRSAPAAGSYVIDDYECRLRGGTLLAADDAAECGWFGPAELARLPLVAGLLDALAEWGVVEVGPDGRTAVAVRRPGDGAD